MTMDNTPVRMDARKLLRNFNQSAQSRIAFFEHLVRKMGQSAKKPYILAALHNDTLVFEDKASNDFYSADIAQEHNRITITNVRRIEIVEEQKSEDFEKNVIGLVEALSNEDNIKESVAEAEKYWNSLSRQKFRSTVVPNSGFVTTRDGIVRKIKVSTGIVPAESVERIATLVSEAVKEKVEISEGRIVKCSFIEGEAPFSLPITEMTRRRVIARKMHTVAESAYKSKTFCNIIAQIAGLVCEGKVREAVVAAYKFLKEEQEFCLLTLAETRTLVENALAVNGEFNSILARDIAKLFFKTNLKVNRNDIIEAWTKTAQIANETELYQQVQALRESDNFAADYQEMLKGILNEENGILRNRGKTYLNCLKIMRSVLSKIEGEEQLVEHMGKMIAALQSGDVDTATILEAESLIASVDANLIDQVSSLEQFDNPPSDPMDLADQDQGADAGQPVDLNDDSLGQPGAFDFDALGANSEEPGIGAPNTGLDAGGADMGAEPQAQAPSMGGRPRPAPGRMPKFPAQPLAAGLERKAEPVAEAAEDTFTPVEEMTKDELHEELVAWKVYGKQFVKEDDDCLEQMDRLIKRCTALGESADDLRKEFDVMRENIATVGDAINENDLEDRYSQYKAEVAAKINPDYRGVIESKEQGSDGVEKASSVKETDCKTGDKPHAGEGAPPKNLGSMGKDFQGDKGVQAKGVKESPHLAKQDGEAKTVGGKTLPKKNVRVMEGTAMDSPTGKGLVGSSHKETDCRTGEKSAGEGAAAAMPPGGLGMSELQKGNGVTGKSVTKSDAKSAGSTAGNSGLEGGDKKAPSPDDKIQKKASGKSNDAMEAPTGKGLAEAKKCVCGHKNPDDCKTCKTCGKACCSTESQYKWGTKRHAQGGSGGGRQKAKLAKEDINISVSGADQGGRAIEFSMSSPDGDINSIIDAIVANMGGGAQDMVTEPDMGAVPPTGEEPMPDMGDMMGDEDPMAGMDDVAGQMDEPVGPGMGPDDIAGAMGDDDMGVGDALSGDELPVDGETLPGEEGAMPSPEGEMGGEGGIPGEEGDEIPGGELGAEEPVGGDEGFPGAPEGEGDEELPAPEGEEGGEGFPGADGDESESDDESAEEELGIEPELSDKLDAEFGGDSEESEDEGESDSDDSEESESEDESDSDDSEESESEDEGESEESDDSEDESEESDDSDEDESEEKDSD